MTYTIKNYEQERLDSDAREVLLQLKLELACRESNEHIGSGFGGNPTDFLFMLTNPIETTGIRNGDPSFKLLDGKIHFCSPRKANLTKVREAFNQFLEVNFPNRPPVKQEQLKSVSYMRHCIPQTLEVKLFIQALEHTQELANWLDAKKEMVDKLNGLAERERQSLVVLFLRERGLPETYFQDLPEEVKSDPIRRMFNRHPIWGTRARAIDERYGKITAQLLSPEDNEKLEMCGAFPPHIALFVVRSFIGIERMISMSLDELPACKFLSEINKMMGGQKDDDQDDALDLED